jgi:antitoxin (DNA-binding transcriptional repressor) of toxin-antitoxin stability system
VPQPGFDLVYFMVYCLTMIKVNIHEAKTNLSAYLERLARGETIVLCKRNVPIAEIRPLPAARTSSRPVGLAAGSFKIPDSFFAPLPEDLTRSFEGESK